MDYRKYYYEGPKRPPENIEWSITYAYNAPDRTHPRVLLVGDSICRAYHDLVRTELADLANVTYWASSKCVTSEDYFRELDFVTDGAPFAAVMFNNTCHSLGTDEAAYAEAYGLALDFLAEKCKSAKRFVVLGTPNRNAGFNEKIKRLNAIASEKAGERALPVVDLFAPVAALDRALWRDDFHFFPDAVGLQARIVAGALLPLFSAAPGGNVQLFSVTGPDGALK